MLKSIIIRGYYKHSQRTPYLIKEKLMTFVAMSERNSLEEKSKIAKKIYISGRSQS